MERSSFLSLVITILAFKSSHGEENISFPESFLIGAASAAYQIEGGWNASDKGVNVWDHFTHTQPWKVFDRSNGDVACDSYHKYKEDVALLENLGVDYYRFSLSWSRILPTGFANVVSRDGIQYYRNLINELLAKGIEPFVTLFHWDHPEVLEQMGGWTNDLMVDWFADYARVVFRELGTNVKYYVTINEPLMVCEGYAGGLFAPGKNLSYIGSYACLHNVLKAHAKAYHIYDKEFRAQQAGKVSIVIACNGMYAKNESDITAEDVYFQYACGRTAHPIFSSTGDYPEIVKVRVAENSLIKGYPRSQLPEFSADWISYIKGTADFFALNHYTSFTVESIPRDKENGVWYENSGVRTGQDPRWPKTPSSWLRVVPDGLAKVLRKIKTEYGNPPVYILENGVADTGTLIDYERIDFLYSYVKAMLSAIHQDGCNVKAYTVWSVLDNFEWDRGYSEKFGIVNVDFESPNRTRIPKLSMTWLKSVIAARKLLPTIMNPN